ncbi:reverse transcriptase/maturase family protein [Marinomonas balearica]|uniref:Retron-type reverse transcriptase n=1 Tax=Marinomonas balearica TaxID=491947 RepID=A0A4R6M753_9GAMM|nr:reverse transcriptase/maturase family protein [Marinomonas balearica]TDO96685.1 retron-type reverse transcriptase [Marinomonas balearica]
MLELIASSSVLDKAYQWLCHRRQHTHANNDVWHLRFHWQRLKPVIQSALLNGEYQFSPCKAFSVAGESVGQWNAQDAMVIKAIALVLTEKISPKLSPHCYHLAGKGQKACVNQVKDDVSDYQYVCRSDVDSYYATIDHGVLLKQLRELIADSRVIDLIETLLNRLDDVNGHLYTVTTGINKGSSLSPLLGAIYLLEMDKTLGEYTQRHGLKYYRYMDDWLILCKTRNQLRTTVKLMNQCLTLAKQTKHPFKTYIGRIKDDGFDFLGYRVIKQSANNQKTKLTLSWKSLSNHLTKLQQLYEQGTPSEGIAEYIKRWLSWARGGVEIDLIKVIREGITSEMAKRINGTKWLEEIYGLALGEMRLI